jgi:low molecular weight protein-tyrosine phosphatase
VTPVRLCFVCLGNICRSPTAAGVMRHHVDAAGLSDRILVESAGTGGWHVGDLPDERARAEARRRGIDIDDPARQFSARDFERFDLVLAMDQDNAEDLRRLTRDEAQRRKIRVLRDFDPASPPGAAVPDPYYGGHDGFADVFDLVDAACRGLLTELVEHDGLFVDRDG